MIYSVSEILKDLEHSISKKEPFSLIRFGDGTLKALDAFLLNDSNLLNAISIQEGIPIKSYEKIIQFWVQSANVSNYIDSAEVYFSGQFWPRLRTASKTKEKKFLSEKTMDKIKRWKQIYNDSGIINENYCNPEINFLMCLTKFRKRSLPSLLRDKKICCISCRDDINQKIPNLDIDVVKIVGKNQNQYEKSFLSTIEKIDENSTKYDIWLVAAGELGRLYPGLIKFKGGRAIDIGSLIDTWCGDPIPQRLRLYIQRTIHHPLKFSLTKDGEEFKSFI